MTVFLTINCTTGFYLQTSMFVWFPLITTDVLCLATANIRSSSSKFVPQPLQVIFHLLPVLTSSASIIVLGDSCLITSVNNKRLRADP